MTEGCCTMQQLIAQRRALTHATERAQLTPTDHAGSGRLLSALNERVVRSLGRQSAASCSRAEQALAGSRGAEPPENSRAQRPLFCNAPMSPERSSGLVWREAASGVSGRRPERASADAHLPQTYCAETTSSFAAPSFCPVSSGFCSPRYKSFSTIGVVMDETMMRRITDVK